MKSTVIKELIENEPEKQEESMKVGILLSLSIGILNACTYVTRGHVFASSQSGNLLYLGLDLAAGEFSNVVKYLFPPIMFELESSLLSIFMISPTTLNGENILFI